MSTRKFALEIHQRSIEKVDPTRFQKLEGEHKQLKDMKKSFKKKMKAKLGKNATNKQIFGTFTKKEIITL